MTDRTAQLRRMARSIAPLALSGSIFWFTPAFAQTIGPDETVGPRGDVGQAVALTPAQKNAVYNAVSRQRVRASQSAIPVAVGAPVPAAVKLADLPDETGVLAPALLKYAMVQDDVIVVDPVNMRVVDIIRGNAEP
jgi:hypothetical protein